MKDFSPPLAMLPELSKTYSPQEIEPRWARAWVERRLFEASNDPADPRPVWSLAIPPPNVTGSLHMGHMLEHTLIDIVVRWQRMQGKNTLWLPGTDHAGIATQMVVERALAAEGKSRQAIGREAFEAAVWAWKRQSGDRIREQMIRLGASCDWSRARFTLDEGLSRAVREVFVQLYEQGLIYRGRYVVNWCPRCLTAVSDLEVTHEAAAGKLYRVRYRLAGESAGFLLGGEPAGFLEVATTRPETILADVAVAVNPADARYQAFVGRQVEVPLAGRTVPVIADAIAQPEFGTGVVKITPGHDVNDFAAGERHRLPQLEVIAPDGTMTAAAGPYAGLDRFAARERFVADLERAGLLAGADAYDVSLGRCQRCRTVIEPRLSLQWFVRTQPLAAVAAAAAERGEVAFVPESSGRVYLEWMANIHDWCISRQLWWGHRIPAWHCGACGALIVAREAPEACACGGALRQDEDVLDTWFSSGLWPFSTLGWPDKTADLAKFYPTSLLITGFDILFFWVARMLMLGCRFTGEVPFRQVYIHALVRDAERQKMSKTKGNVIDPLVVTDRYGTDAVRFTLAAMAVPGTDIALSEERMAGYAAFANKIWNAARFIFLNLNQCAAPAPAATARLTPRGGNVNVVDRWIFSRLNAVAAELDRHLAGFRFHDAAAALYQFFWREFCDWYLELYKLRQDKEEASAHLAVAFEGALRLLHPLMPFITEELWQALYAGQAPGASIALAPYPRAEPAAADAPAEAEIAKLQAVVTEVRRLAAGHRAFTLRWSGEAGRTVAWDWVRALTRSGAIEEQAPQGVANRGEAAGVQLQVMVTVDLAAERARWTKERAAAALRLQTARAKLASAAFRERAQPAVVAETERLAAELERQLAQTEAHLAALGAG
jgi:valyl-tRNA synthetase